MSIPPPPGLVTVGDESSGSDDDAEWAWGLFVACYRPWMLRQATMKCGNDAIAEDAVANVLTWICEERYRFAPENLHAVLRIRVRMAVHVLMRSRERRHARNASWLGERPRHEPAVEAQCHEQELLGKLEEALETISTRRRHAFELVKMEGRSYAEAGEVMGVKGAVVKNYVRAALRAPAMEAFREFLVGEVDGRG